MKGMDVSVHNGNIDWNKVKNAGIQFAILRAGYGKTASQKDKKFEENYAGAKAAGVPLGAYWYSYAKTVAEARQEERDILATGKANCSAMVRAFCEVLEKAGYWVGLYTSRSFLAPNIEDDIKSRYALWIAEWGSKLNYSGSVGIWQNSDKGRVDGISGNVDLDECYVDYAKIIKEKGLNGFTAVSQPSDPVTLPTEMPFPSEEKDADKTTAAVVLQIGDDIYKGTLTKV